MSPQRLQLPRKHKQHFERKCNPSDPKGASTSLAVDVQSRNSTSDESNYWRSRAAFVPREHDIKSRTTGLFVEIHRHPWYDVALQFCWEKGECGVGWFLLRKFYFFNFYMVSSCSIWSPIFKTVFVFDVRPFLLLSVKFFGFNGNFNGKMTKINKMAKNHFSGV